MNFFFTNNEQGLKVRGKIFGELQNIQCRTPNDQAVMDTKNFWHLFLKY